VVISRALINLVEAQIQTSANAGGNALINSVAGALGSRHCNMDEWRTLLEALERGERVGRIVLVKGMTKSASYLRTAAPSVSTSYTAPTTSSILSTSALITRSLIRAVEARIAEFADSTGRALMTTIGGICGNAAICTRDQWQALTQALERGDAVGRIVLIKFGVKQAWQLQLAVDGTASSSLPLAGLATSATTALSSTPAVEPQPLKTPTEGKSSVPTAPVVPQPSTTSTAMSATSSATNATRRPCRFLCQILCSRNTDNYQANPMK
jgi:hypothetical protein